MFENDRYMTKGIEQRIPLELQLFLWNCIDNLRENGKELDYLQVFELGRVRVDDIFIQEIEHRQEVPVYSMKYKLFPADVVDAKIFVVDDGENSVMMLAEEY